MPFNGSGVFQSLTPPNFPAVAGQVIYADRFNANMNDLFAGLTNCVTRDGQSPASANLPMNGYLLTGIGQASLDGHSLAWGKNAKIGNLEYTGTLTGGSGNATLGGNAAIGSSPSAWGTAGTALEVGPAARGFLFNDSNNLNLGVGAYYNAGWKYGSSGVAVSRYTQSSGGHAWYQAPAGASGAAITWLPRMTLDGAGNLLLGVSSAVSLLTVGGDVTLDRGAGTDVNINMRQSGTSNWSLRTLAGANTFSLVDNTAGERLRVNSSGNLGVSDNNPGYRLSVISGGGGAADATPLRWQAPSSVAGYLFSDAAGVGISASAGTSMANGVYVNSASLQVATYVNGTARFRVLQNELLFGTSSSWSGNTSALSLRYAGLGSIYGLALGCADSSGSQSTAIVFLAGADAAGSAATLKGSISQSFANMTYYSAVPLLVKSDAGLVLNGTSIDLQATSGTVKYLSNEIGFRDQPYITASAGGTDWVRGYLNYIFSGTTWTPRVQAVGNVFTVFNATGSAITLATTYIDYRHPLGTGARTLAANGCVTLRYINSGATAILDGTGIS